MKKLLNTLYVTDPTAYLSLDGENLVCKKSDGTFRLPFANIESIFCFSYAGCSPAVMGKCADENVALSFFTPGGRFLARVTCAVKGNVFLRKQQLDVFGDEARRLALIRNTVAAKLTNTRSVLRRTLRDYPDIPSAAALAACADKIAAAASRMYETSAEDEIRGMEGSAAKAYFDVFDGMILQQKDEFTVYGRTKRPPLDRVNAMLSFLYAIYTLDFASALEAAGLDPYIGFYHTLRPGRASLACDLVEEARAVVERLVLTMINLRIIRPDDFTVQATSAVLLNDGGRKKVLTRWQERKREEFRHPVLRQKIPVGLLPFVQANLLAKFVRGEMTEYPPFLL